MIVNSEVQFLPAEWYTDLNMTGLNQVLCTLKLHTQQVCIVLSL